MSGVAIYMEGGGNGKNAKARCRHCKRLFDELGQKINEA